MSDFDQLPVAVVDQIVRQQEEIERLRAEVASLNQPVKLSEWQELVAERDRLREAERDRLRELLKKCRGEIEYQDRLLSKFTNLSSAPHPALADIDAALGGRVTT